MSDRAIDLNLTDKSDSQVVEEHKEKQMTRAELKAHLVTILSRSVVSDRLNVPLPDDVHGEWFPNDKGEILRAEMLGFKIDTEYAKKRSLHQDSKAGADSSTVSDAVFMVCSKQVKEVMDEINLERYNAANSPRRGRQKEERDFETETQQQNLPSQIKSRSDAVDVEGIKAVLSATS